MSVAAVEFIIFLFFSFFFLVFPLLEENPLLFAYACDFSPRAVTFVQVFKNVIYGRRKIPVYRTRLYFYTGVSSLFYLFIFL